METNQIMVKMALDAWNSQIAVADKLINGLSDEQLNHEAAPGRNRGTYLLGHLTAVHDRMIPLLNFGKQNFPELNEPFLEKADKTVELPAVSELRSKWKKANENLAANFNKMNPEEWFQRHTSVSEEDFAKEPHRNRLNIIITRTNHLTYHLGQLNFLKK
jgi:hypothetical protein